ncbi:MAG: ATP-binding cassette domain-containing protein, partial [Halomonas sp.]|nr:ATP-binding cassette domain-containing protein [Halomonas sp.]
MASVTLEKINKTFGSTHIIKDLDLQVADGEFVVFVGPSGCGKSTLLRLIAGLESITDGELKIADGVVNDLPPRERGVGMVFQSYALYPHMSVYENMAFGLKLAKMAKETVDDRVMATARILQLEDLLHRKPKELSGGQRQRVAMGRAMAREPRILLFDEPL